MGPRLQRLLIVTNDFESIFVAWCQMVAVDGGKKGKVVGVYNRLLITDEKRPQGPLTPGYKRPEVINRM